MIGRAYNQAPGMSYTRHAMRLRWRSALVVLLFSKSNFREQVRAVPLHRAVDV